MKQFLLLVPFLALGHLTKAQTFLTENFDTGIPVTWTITDYLTDGLTWKGTTGGYGGNYLDGTEFAIVDSDADGNGIEMIEDLTSPVFDPGAPATLLLEFDHYFRSLNTLDTGKVEVFDGTSWVTVATYVGVNYGAWAAPDQPSINITAYANPNMQIRFHYDDNNSWAWYWSIDNVRVFAPALDDAGITALVAPATGGRELTTSSLSATETITVTIENFGGAAASNIPVYYRIDGGAPVMEVYAGPLATATTYDYSFTATADLSVPGNHTIDAWTAVVGDGDMLNDSLLGITRNQVGNPVIMLPYCQDWEATSPAYTTQVDVVGIPGATEADFFTNNQSLGRLRAEAGVGFPRSGTKAMTLDMNPSGVVVINYLIMTWNMSGFATTDSILLDFSLEEHGDEVQANDSVWVRGSDTDPWIGIMGWNTFTGGTNGVYANLSNFDLSNTLANNGQSYSTSTQIRFGQEDNFPATSPTASDGLTVDDVKLRMILGDDIAVTNILSPSDNDCGDSTALICVVVQNAGTATQSNIPVTVQVTGAATATFMDTLAGPLNSGQSDTICLGPLNTFAGGVYNLTAYSSLAIDTTYGNDTVTTSVSINGISIPSVIGDTICAMDSTMLIATHDTLITQISWFANPMDTLPFATGDTLWTGSLTQDTTVWAFGASQINAAMGPADNTIGAGADYTFYADGLIFDAFAPFTIDSVTVYPNVAGNVVIVVEDAAAGLIGTVTVAVAPTVAGEATRIPVGISVPAGIGHEINATGTTTGLWRNSGGAVYPYLGGSLGQITGSINALAGYYYFWYDWQITGGGCEGPMVPVTVTVLPSAVTAGFSSLNAGLTVDFTDASVGANSWLYDFGDGNTSTQQNPQHTYAVDGAYTVCLIASNDCTADTTCSVETVCSPVSSMWSFVQNGGAGYTYDFTDLSTGTPVSWMWDFGDGNTSTQQNPSHTYANDTSVTVFLIVTNLCGDTSSFSMPLIITDVVADPDLGQIKYYPNPSNGLFTLEAINLTGNDFNIRVFNLYGQVVYQRGFGSLRGRLREEIDLSGVSKGTYFMEMNLDGTTRVSKVILH